MDIYYLPDSPPCRLVFQTATYLGLELNKKILDVLSKKHLEPEFVKINPQHTIPTLVDNGFSIWESRAVSVYLIEKYAKNDVLYPKCPKKQGLVNQRLFFDLGTLYRAFSDYYFPQMFAKVPADPEKFKTIEIAFDFLNQFLEGNKYVAGDELTVADFAILTTVLTFVAMDFDISKYSNVAKWYENAKTLPGWQENWEGALLLKEYFK